MHVSPQYSRILFQDAKAVQDRLDRMAEEIRRHYTVPALHLVYIEKGARRMAEALAERLQPHLDLQLHAIRAQRSSGQTLGEVTVHGSLPAVLTQAPVLLIDDILDQGRTLAAVQQRVLTLQPASLQVAVLLRRTGVQQPPLPVLSVGFEIGPGWVVGFGMDLDEQFRDLDELFILEPPGD